MKSTMTVIKALLKGTMTQCSQPLTLSLTISHTVWPYWPITILSRLLYDRTRPLLDSKQPPDQVGFWFGSSADDAFAVWEEMRSKTVELNVSFWAASIDLTKAFDRVEWSALLDALGAHELPDCYITLVQVLYQGEKGIVNDASQAFGIQRRVRHGNVIRSLLFNAGLELARSRWEVRLQDHGWQLSTDNARERLTNVRYADDLMLGAKS